MQRFFLFLVSFQKKIYPTKLKKIEYTIKTFLSRIIKSIFSNQKYLKKTRFRKIVNSKTKISPKFFLTKTLRELGYKTSENI